MAIVWGGGRGFKHILEDFVTTNFIDLVALKILVTKIVIYVYLLTD